MDSAYLSKAAPVLLTKNIIMVEHSEPFFTKSPPLQDFQFTNYCAVPKVFFGWDVDFFPDNWAIGCLIYKMRSSAPLFRFAIQNPLLETVFQIIGRVGKLP